MELYGPLWQEVVVEVAACVAEVAIACLGLEDQMVGFLGVAHYSYHCWDGVLHCLGEVLYPLHTEPSPSVAYFRR